MPTVVHVHAKQHSDFYIICNDHSLIQDKFNFNVLPICSPNQICMNTFKKRADIRITNTDKRVQTLFSLVSNLLLCPIIIF